MKLIKETTQFTTKNMDVPLELTPTYLLMEDN